MPKPQSAKASRPAVGKLYLKNIVALVVQSGVVLGGCALLHMWSAG
jgi:hypothetical protein